MNYRNERQKTFDQPVKAEGKTFNWNDIIEFTPSFDLVEAGFYFTPTKRRKNRITCTYCNKSIIIQKDFKYDRIVTEHLKRNSNCPMSMILDLLDSSKDLPENEKQSFWENSRFKNPLDDDSIAFRRQFFNDFPLNKVESKPNSDSLAKAGFIYQPRQFGDDRVLCMFCKCALDYWEKDDDPTEEHTKNANNYCYILDMIKKQNEKQNDRIEEISDASCGDISLLSDSNEHIPTASSTKEPNISTTKEKQKDSKIARSRKRKPPDFNNDLQLDQNHLNKSTKKRKTEPYGKKDENLDYWNKLPDDDLLQEFIQVSKSSDFKIRPTDKESEVGANIDQYKSTIQDVSSKPKEDDDLASKDLDDVLKCDSQPKEVLSEDVSDSKNSIEGALDLNVNSEDEVESELDFESISTSDEYEPTQDSNQVNSIEKITKQIESKKVPSTTPRLPKKMSILSSSPAKSKVIIKRNTPIPIFEDTSTDNDYGENHVAKLEKKVIKSTTPILPVDEDSNDLSSEIRNSPIRMSPTKVTTKRAEGVKPSLFDSSVDFSLDNISPIRPRTAAFAAKQKVDLNKNISENKTIGVLEERKFDTVEIKKPKSPFNVLNNSHLEAVSTNLFVQSSTNDFDPFDEPSKHFEVDKLNETSGILEDVIAVPDASLTTERNGRRDEPSSEHQSLNPETSQERSHQSEMVQDFLDDNLTTSTPKHKGNTETSVNLTQLPEITKTSFEAEAFDDVLEIKGENDLDKQMTNEQIEVGNNTSIVANSTKIEAKGVDLSDEKEELLLNEENLEDEIAINDVDSETSNDVTGNISVGSELLSISNPISAEKSNMEKEDLPSESSNKNENRVHDISESTTAKKSGSENGSADTNNRLNLDETNKHTKNPKSSVTDPDNSDKENNYKLGIELTKKTSTTSSIKLEINSENAILQHPQFTTSSTCQTETPTSTESSNQEPAINKDKLQNSENKSQNIEIEEEVTNSQSKWEPRSMDNFLQQVEDLKNSSKELKQLSTLNYELSDDVNGDLTGFISEMPEDEEQMTIKQWIEHCAINCRDIVSQSVEELNKHILEEYDRAIKAVEMMDDV
ncbi:hypothetical protein KGF54_002331 [Candida jiufengensis]|uniref:uncharacterized protein n=1 Tax=Candida jiufengensis TaxID=497108 RepID=UPI0022243439|nr:uncharacterized protein KGF54_002331 [Candida jiufengensis]KAI5954556.1 hypothetical protein KGF54_002331 [Candida jiufengensis]